MTCASSPVLCSWDTVSKEQIRYLLALEPLAVLQMSMGRAGQRFSCLCFPSAGIKAQLGLIIKDIEFQRMLPTSRHQWLSKWMGSCLERICLTVKEAVHGLLVLWVSEFADKKILEASLHSVKSVSRGKEISWSLQDWYFCLFFKTRFLCVALINSLCRPG